MIKYVICAIISSLLIQTATVQQIRTITLALQREHMQIQLPIHKIYAQVRAMGVLWDFLMVLDRINTDTK
jgi:hypothetical protein